MPFPAFTSRSMSCRLLLVAAAFALAPAAALADFHLCNNTGSRVGIAVGYKDTDGSWVTEGWWNLSARSCETVLKGTLIARFLLHLRDRLRPRRRMVRPGLHCTRDKEFTIKGTQIAWRAASTAPASSRSTPAEQRRLDGAAHRHRRGPAAASADAGHPDAADAGPAGAVATAEDAIPMNGFVAILQFVPRRCGVPVC